jgi:hypothetical protein
MNEERAMYDNEDDEAYLEAREQERLATATEQVALAEREAPQELVELRASFTKEQLLEIVAERAMERMFGRYGNEGLDREVRKHVHAMVEAAAHAEIEKHVSAAIGAATERLLADGFQQTDSYGNAKGERKTVGAFVLEYLQAKTDSYGRGNARIYEAADKLVQSYLEKHIAPELEKLKKRCAEALDTSVTGKIREAVIAGLGLRA